MQTNADSKVGKIKNEQKSCERKLDPIEGAIMVKLVIEFVEHSPNKQLCEVPLASSVE